MIAQTYDCIIKEMRKQTKSQTQTLNQPTPTNLSTHLQHYDTLRRALNKPQI